MSAKSAEELADEFDRDLYRLMGRAEIYSEQGTKAQKNAWSDIAGRLRATRPIVRIMMDEKTRSETRG